MKRRRSFYDRVVKRGIDLCISALALLLLSPLIGVIALLVRIKHGSPVLFSQERPGLDERIFRMYKFRSMTNERDADGNLLPDDKRLTKLGKFLRATSLDELPELWNILKGDLSLIGPRPLLVRYLPRYSERQHKRHSVRPGMTGWAQVHGRNTVSWQDKFEYDVWYAEHISFALDVRIFFMTIVKVLKREGINSETAATMEEFRGNGGIKDA
jgi:lipopolysaccharide/colanic/teichoic acid biosynthesis glycosyltransferase